VRKFSERIAVVTTTVAALLGGITLNASSQSVSRTDQQSLARDGYTIIPVEDDSFVEVPNEEVASFNNAKTSALGGTGTGFTTISTSISGYLYPTFTIKIVNSPEMDRYLPALRESLAKISQATGLTLNVDSNRIAAARAPLNGEIIISTVPTSSSFRLGCPPTVGIIGCGGPQTLGGKIGAGRLEMLAPFGCDEQFAVVAAHELGHVFGLGHTLESYGTPTPRLQLMYPSTATDAPSFRSGDLRGLGAIAGRNALESGLTNATSDSTNEGVARKRPTAVTNPTPESVVQSATTSDSATTAGAVGDVLYSKVPNTRIFDSRSVGTKAPFGNGESRTIIVPAQAGFPTLDSVVVNVTVAGASGGGYVSVYPTGAAPAIPTSNVNYDANHDVANAAILKLGAGNSLTVFNSGGPAHVLIDISGVFSASATGGFRALNPLRAYDSRSSDVPNERGLPFACGIPYEFLSSDVGAPATSTGQIINVTAVETNGAGYVSVSPIVTPKGVEAPTSNINVLNNDTRPNLVFTSGNTWYVRNSDTVRGDILVDVAGYFIPRSLDATGASFQSISPLRALDTRSNLGLAGRQSTTIRTLTIPLPAGIPASRIAAVALNATVEGASADGYLTVGTSGVGLPNVSNVNYKKSEAVANLAVVKVGPNNTVDIFASAGSPNVIFDVAGYFLKP
jgi:hypothetical protein